MLAVQIYTLYDSTIRTPTNHLYLTVNTRGHHSAQTDHIQAMERLGSNTHLARGNGDCPKIVFLLYPDEVI